jgi:hypothetical protein
MFIYAKRVSENSNPSSFSNTDFDPAHGIQRAFDISNGKTFEMSVMQTFEMSVTY